MSTDAPSPTPAAPRHQRRRLWLFLFVWVTISVHAHPGMIHPTFLTLSIIHDGTFRINRYANINWDQSYRDGNYYYGRSPGVSLLGLPFALATHVIYHHVLPDGLQQRLQQYTAKYYSNVGLRGLQAASQKIDLAEPLLVSIVMIFTINAAAAAGATVVFYNLLGKFHFSETAKTGLSMTVVLGTLIGVYATANLAHAPTALCTLFCFQALIRARQSAIGASSVRWAGAAVGLMMLLEYQTIFLAAILAGYAFYVLPRRQFGTFSFSAMLTVAPLPIYHLICFGSPFKTSFSFPSYPDSWGAHALTFQWPTVAAIWDTLFSPKFGHFIAMPIMLVGVAYAVVSLVRNPRLRAEAAVALSVFTVYTLFISSLGPEFQAESFIGSRYLIVSVPFLYLFAALAIPAGRTARWIVAGAAILSLLICLVGIQYPSPSEPIARSVNPLIEVYWPMIIEYGPYSTLLRHLCSVLGFSHTATFVFSTLVALGLTGWGLGLVMTACRHDRRVAPAN